MAIVFCHNLEQNDRAFYRQLKSVYWSSWPCLTLTQWSLPRSHSTVSMEDAVALRHWSKVHFPSPSLMIKVLERYKLILGLCLRETSTQSVHWWLSHVCDFTLSERWVNRSMCVVCVCDTWAQLLWLKPVTLTDSCWTKLLIPVMAWSIMPAGMWILLAGQLCDVRLRVCLCVCVDAHACMRSRDFVVVVCVPCVRHRSSALSLSLISLSSSR
jgi:hypothetical protein